MKRILILLFILKLQLLAGVGRADGEAMRPNVVFIMADDLGYSDLNAYGQELFETPNTNRLAEEGLRLTRAYSPSAICTPSRYGLLTGTDPHRTYHNSHVLFNGEPLIIKEGEMTIAEMFQELGYRTGIVGKWHLGLGDELPRNLNAPGRGPNEVGFDYSFIVPDGHNMYPRNYHENGAIYGGSSNYRSTIEVLTRTGYKFLQHKPEGKWENRRPDHQVGTTLADKADSFIEANAESPFFLYYPTCSIHFPLTADPRFEGKSGIGDHGDFVMEFDWAVGRVMETLERFGLAENTILIVTSDHGGYPQEGFFWGKERSLPYEPTAPWRGNKSSHYDGGFRIPFLVRWPGNVEGGAVSDLPVSLVDMFGTFAGLLEYSIPTGAALDSFDVSSQWLHSGEVKPVRKTWFTATRGMQYVAAYENGWKLIVQPEGNRKELYNVEKDPAESENLVDEEPDRVREMETLLKSYFADGSTRPGANASGSTLSAVMREKEVRNRKIEVGFAPRKEEQ